MCPSIYIYTELYIKFKAEKSFHDDVISLSQKKQECVVIYLVHEWKVLHQKFTFFFHSKLFLNISTIKTADRHRNSTSIVGRGATLWVAENYLVNTLTLVAYEVKLVWKFLQQKYHKSMFDTVLIFSKITSDN